MTDILTEIRRRHLAEALAHALERAIAGLAATETRRAELAARMPAAGRPDFDRVVDELQLGFVRGLMEFLDAPPAACVPRPIRSIPFVEECAPW